MKERRPRRPIANFVNGKWPNLALGNHSGFTWDKYLTVKKRKGEHAGENEVEIRCL